MRYRISDGETVSEGVRRIALGQIDRALNGLELKTRNKDRAVHDVRVSFKKIRALLRLIQAELGPESFKLENREYRDAGRKLSDARDTVVIADTLEEMVKLLDKHLADPNIKLLRKRLRRSRVEVRIDKKRVLREVAESIKSARQRVETWTIGSDSFSALRPGLLLVYESGRACLDRVTSEPTTENLHEWRKQVKYLLYQISILNPLWPKPMDVLGRELNKLSDYLSEDHDLALLRKTAVDQADVLGKPGEIEKLVLLIDQRRAQLQTRAAGVGARLYAEKPKRFANRIEAYWRAWRPSEAVEPVEANQLTFAAYEAASNK
jgi:CHAD domain-containing protein